MRKLFTVVALVASLAAAQALAAEKAGDASKKEEVQKIEQSAPEKPTQEKLRGQKNPQPARSDVKSRKGSK